MSIIRNRELSQFGSFIFVDNTSENLAITEGASPYVGIGTTVPEYKLDVYGDSRVQGGLEVSAIGIGTTVAGYQLDVLGDSRIQGSFEASSYTLNGSPLVNAAVQFWTIGTGGDDIYRLQGNVGIGTSVISEKLTVDGNISASGDISAIGIVTATGTITGSQFISTVSTGTAPFEVSSLTLVTHLNADYLRGKIPPSGDIVGNNDSQILTNKTIDLANNTLTGTAAEFNAAVSDTDFATLSGTETLTNKTLITPIISGIRPSSGQLQTIPSGTGTLVSTNSSGVVTSAMIADGTIVNGDISASAAIAISKLSASTISGISLGSNLNNLTAGSYITYNSGSTYNGSTARTISVNASSSNTANAIVARNASGDFTAGTVTASVFNATTTDAFKVGGTTVINSSRNLVNVVNGTFSGALSASSISVTSSLNINGNLNVVGVVTATDFNSTSDINVKENIHTIKNSLETISSLRGVSFDWKETGKSSYGVIAQELEEVLPELVGTGEVKSVNYNGLVGVLIEAIKELKKEIEELKNNK